jgi:hypothetical protein
MDAIPEFTRDVLVSIHPRHASKILNGEKTSSCVGGFLKPVRAALWR